MMSLEFIHTYTHCFDENQVYKYTLKFAAINANRNELQ
jgi:hypothetical protein